MNLALGTTEMEEFVALIKEQKDRQDHNKLFALYPETGPLRRELYTKHLAFFAAGKESRIRGFSAAHRIGKTWGSGGYELILHATGLYPAWWTGRRFNKGLKCWVAGDTNQTTKDIIQLKLFGDLSDPGTGLIPRDRILDWKKKATSVPDTLETIFVRHVSGEVSTIGLKSYEQKKKAFYGTEMDVILLDEEPPMDIYLQCLVRTMIPKGLVMITFTPLKGTSEVVRSLENVEENPTGEKVNKCVIRASWEDAPHLTSQDKKELWNEIPPHLRDAMTKGIPSIGSGAIYPIAWEEVSIDDFEIPSHWPKAYALDVGWNCTASVWRARDPETDVRYLYSEHKMGEALPLVHTEAVKARGSWIRGVADPASMSSSQKDGEKLFNTYKGLGLELTIADNAVETGLFDVWMALNHGKLKVFKSLRKWKDEFTYYQRDEHGHVVKKEDHLMDCTRYLERSGRRVERVVPPDIYAMKMLEKLGAFGRTQAESLLFHGLSANQNN